MIRVPSKQLSHGNLIPQLGAGTFKLRSSDNDDCVDRTLKLCFENGYRLIDTAGCYRNEKSIGECLKRYLSYFNIDRSDVFITSKLAPKDLGYDEAISAFHRSLLELDCGYIDLYLIHWPGKVKHKLDDPIHKLYREKSWRALEKLKEEGYVKSIGVSNFTHRHLEELSEYAVVSPSVNQVEFHPHLYRKDLLEYCTNSNIFLQAYSSLGTGQLINDNAIIDIARQVDKSPAQILLRWGIQHGVGVIPKSTNPSHIKDNLDIFHFSLSDTHMDILDSMNIDKHYCWNPNTVR